VGQVACAEDRLRRGVEGDGVRPDHRDHRHAEALADPRLAQRLVGEGAVREPDFLDVRERGGAGGVVGASAHHRIPEPLEIGDRTILRQPENGERVADERGRGFDFGLDDLAHAQRVKGFRLPAAVRAREQRHVGVEVANRADGALGGPDLGQGDDDERGGCGAGVEQHVAVAGVAEERVNTSPAQLLDQVRIALDHDERDAERLERLPDGAAHPSVAAQHDVW